uniref:Uncharacterized protein n=1 Tax=Zosterops lateralis melanops TaxID=1220523 RepID=A0A8D2P1Z7_ZOSLA
MEPTTFPAHTSYHFRINYLDPSTSAFANSIWHSSTRWVNHRHQSYKAEFVYREVQVVCIKLEALRELIIRQKWCCSDPRSSLELPSSPASNGILMDLRFCG